MSKRTLPEGYRIMKEMYGGSGRGDELFRYVLQHWGEYTYRRWFRTQTATGWHTIDTASAFAVDYAELVQTARLHHKDQENKA